MNTTLSEVTKTKRQLYTAIARLAWRNDLAEQIDNVPDEILANNDLSYRCCEHKERAILKEKARVILGLAANQVSKHASLQSMAQHSLTAPEFKHSCYVEMLSVACDRCPIDRYVVTDACRNCGAHYCKNTCPKNAITIVNNRAYIDRGRCIECGRCANNCSYHAIVRITRPCEQACAVSAIKPDAAGVAEIDRDKCVGCGACINACPFGSIGDYTHIVPVIEMLKQTDYPVYALIAPAFVGQFGPKVDSGAIVAGLKQLGFQEVIEVAQGAEAVAALEAAEYVERRQDGAKVMTSSCCPAFVELIAKHYPDQLYCVSHTSSPMIQLATEIRDQQPDARLVFVGPCIAKKAEAAKTPHLDAVLTFEEVACMLVGRGVNLASLQAQQEMADAGPLGRGFAKSGGVTEALIAYLPPSCSVPTVLKADGLQSAIAACDNLRAGHLNADFIEGMACVGGCIAGPGTLINPRVAERLLDRFCRAADAMNKATGN